MNLYFVTRHFLQLNINMREKESLQL